MAARLMSVAFWALVILPLALAPLLGLLTPYLSLAFIIPLFFVTLARGEFAAAYATYEARAFLAVFVVMAVVCLVTADSVSDALRMFNFTMLLAYGPLALFLRRESGRMPLERVVQFASIGVAVGLFEVLLSVVLPPVRYMHYNRPTGLDIGPIVLSNALLALGYIALGGILIRRDRLAWLYILAPVGAILATIVTGSRGPLLAVPVATLVAAFAIWKSRFAGSLRAAWIGVIALLALTVAGGAVVLRSRAGSTLDILQTLIGGGTVTDESTAERFTLYSAGAKSFFESPWIGHGWGNIMDSVRPFLPPGNTYVATLPQLHNDVLNFAVGGGIVGVICYLAIISAPIIGALTGRKDGNRRFRLFGTAILAVIYIGGGLTDLMFGFEYHTYLFVMLTAILIAYSGEAERKA